MHGLYAYDRTTHINHTYLLQHPEAFGLYGLNMLYGLYHVLQYLMHTMSIDRRPRPAAVFRLMEPDTNRLYNHYDA